MSSAAQAASGMLAATRKSIDELLGDVGGLLADLTSQEHPTDATDDEENEAARRVIDVELQRFWQGYYELKRRHDENALSVAVLALTKSGKSTLLNSLMGMEVLPMNNVPETARICRINHDAAAREPLMRDATGRVVVRGEAAVRARLQQLNSAARTNGAGGSGNGSGGLLSPQSSGGLLGAGADGSSPNGGGDGGGASLLSISAPLVALEGFGPELGRVTLLDTPGPNEAGEEQLKHQVERLLEGVDCVLYLLDYTKLKTAEEEGLFRRLRAINPQLVARLSSRLFFVINKVDTSETSEGLDPEEVRNYVADLVTRQLGGGGAAAGPPAAGAVPGSPASTASSGSGSPSFAAGAAAAPFRLHPDQVLLLSARNALLARLVLGGKASPDVLKRFQRLAFGAFGGGGMSMGLQASRGVAAGPSNEQIRAAAGCLLEGSGVLELEGRVLAFLAAHVGSVKLLATADDTTRLLAQVHNVALACRSCLHRNVAALQVQTDGLRGELGEATAAFEAVRARTDAVQAEVVAEIRSHLNTLRRRLFTQIVQTLDTDARAPPPQSGAAAAAGPSTGPATGRWCRVREKFLSMFTATCSTLPPQPPQPGCAGSGPSLVSEARSRSREELQSLLLDLHDDLMGQIHSEVYDFWGVLEACAASRHSELLSALNGHLAALSRRVEGAVSETLGVQLAPADIRLRPPSAEQLHSDVQELIEKGIRESTEKHIRVGTRTTMERQPQGPPSLCRWGGYWVEVPRTRTVVETYTATVYSLKPDEIANHFIGLVDGAVTTSERALTSYVSAMVERQLAAAKNRIQEYGDRYLSVMSAALAASSRGAQCRSSALASVEGYLGRLEALVARAEVAQRAAEGAVPGGAAGLMDEVEVYDDDDTDYGQEYGEQAQEQGYKAERNSAGEAAEEQEEEEQPGGAGEEGEEQGKEQGEQQAEEQNEQPDDAGEVAEVVEAGDAAAVAAGQVLTCGDSASPAGHCVGVAAGVAAGTGLTGPSSWSSTPDMDEVGEEDEEPYVEAAQMEAAEAQPGAAEEGAAVLASAAAAADGHVSEAEAEWLPEVDAGGCGDPHVPSLQHVAGAALEAPPPQEEQQEQNAKPQEQQQEEQEGGMAAVEPPTMPVTRGGSDAGVQSGSAGLSGSSVGMAAYAGMPFDYSRAFLEAMSSSEMAAGAKLEEPLTMIPLSSEDGGAGLEGRPFGAAPDGHGSDTPRSGASEEWQLVGEEALEGEEAAASNT